MFYIEARHQIKSGDILAWTHKSWNSWYDIQIQIVRFFTQSEYSHVGIAWVIADRVFVIESVQPKIRIYPLSKSLPFYWIPTRTEWTPELEEYALSKVGEGYSKLDGIKSFLGILHNSDNSVWQCAEYVISVLSKAKILDKEVKATPSVVVQALQDSGNPLYLIKE
jgi:hypothetical protein